MQEYFQLVLYWEVCPLYGVSSFWSALYRRFHCSDLKLTRRTYNMCVMSQTIQSPFLLCSSQPEQFQQKAGASANGAWGSPMATSTQMAGGGGGGGGGWGVCWSEAGQWIDSLTAAVSEHDLWLSS